MRPEDINSLESEAGVIASLIHHPEFCFYSEFLLPNHFTNSENRCLYAAICGLAQRGIKNIDPYNIYEFLNSSEATKKLAKDITIEKLQELVDMSDILTRNTLEEYQLVVNNVLDASFRRDTFKKLKECEALCLDRNVEDIAPRIYTAIDGVMSEFSNANEIPQFKDVVDDYWEEIKSRQGEGFSGIPFKFPTLNEFATIEPGELFIFAAEAKQGKSIMLLNCAVDLLKRDLAVLYLDSELNSRLFTARILSHLSRVEFKRLTSGNYTGEEAERIAQARDWLKTKKFVHIYIPTFDVKSIYTAVKKVQHTQGLDVLIVDYLIVHSKLIELLENPESRMSHSARMKYVETRRRENHPDWAISSQASNRGRFNGHPVWEYATSIAEAVSAQSREDMVYSHAKVWVRILRGVVS